MAANCIVQGSVLSNPHCCARSSDLKSGGRGFTIGVGVCGRLRTDGVRLDFKNDRRLAYRCLRQERTASNLVISASGATVSRDATVTSLPTSGPLAPPQWVLDAVAEQPWKGALEPAPEGTYVVDPSLIEGTVPEELRGCHYTLGPGRVRIGAKKYGHWFDGDGMVHALHLDGPGGAVRLSQRFVRTEKFMKQEKAGSDRIATIGVWTRADGSFFDRIGIPKNPVNTSMLHYGGKLYALCEAGKPMKIEPRSLDTLGFDDFKGPGGDSLGSVAFSAHPKIDPDTGVLYNCGFDEATLAYGVYAISPQGELLKMAVLPNGKFSILHDMALSKNHLTFFIPPYEADPSIILKVVLGFSQFGSEQRWIEGKGTRVVVMSREDMSIKLDTTIPGPFSTYHFANAYEEDNKLHVLVNRLKGPRPALEAMFGDMYASYWQPGNYNEIWDVVFDLATWQVVSQGPAFTPAPGSPPPFGMEFPTVPPQLVGKRTRYIYSSACSGNSAIANLRIGERRGATQMDSVQKYDFETGKMSIRRFPLFYYPSEPEFVPKKDAAKEDDGYIIVNVYNPPRHGTDVYILDAADIEGKPICKIQLPTHIPLYFHGCWVPS